MRNFSLVAAVDANMGISRDGAVPWYLPDDLQYFSELTQRTENPDLRNAVVIDEEGWNMLPASAQPLSGRINVVISTNEDLDLPEEVLQFESLDAALMALATSNIVEQVFVIGNVKLYEEAILHLNLERVYLTKIEEDFDCDTFFPDHIPEEFEVISATEILESNGLEFSFLILEKHEEDDESIDEEEEI